MLAGKAEDSAAEDHVRDTENEAFSKTNNLRGTGIPHYFMLRHDLVKL